MRFHILDLNLKPIYIMDEHRSAIWASRYQELGDCEIYVPATKEALLIFKKNYYICREDDDMVCVIKRLEIDASPEDGVYLVVTGRDVRWYLDQRIVWGTATNNGSQEEYIRQLVTDSVIAPTDFNRRLKKANGQTLITLGDTAGFTAASTEQTSYETIGEKIREVCVSNKWGWKIRKADTDLKFELYAGSDRTESVRFSAALENLETSSFIDDETALGNVALIGGEGEGSTRTLETFGNSVGIYRSERFVDAKDITSQVDYGTLRAAYPTGELTIIPAETGVVYVVPTFRIAVINETHADWLLAHFPNGSIVTIDGAEYVEANDVAVAKVPTFTPKSTDKCTLLNAIYQTYLINRGAENLAQYGEVLTFNGAVVPDNPFKYKRDYFLGDIVTVESEFGIRADARIVEVIETEDENGYLIEPKLEYINVYAMPDDRENIATEDYIIITTETNDPLVTEGE